MSGWVVILAGGGGTRLWPASRRQRPKQFLALAPGDRSLLAATYDRARAIVGPEHILIVTAERQVPAVRETLPGLPGDNLIVEPVGRNTAPAIALAARNLEQRGQSEAVMAVLPSDHVILQEEAFAATLRHALALGEQHLVTIGIRPTGPETGYGYLELDPQEVPEGARNVRRFVEKPDLEHAKAYVASGNYLWNSGMFFFRVDRILAEVRRLLPELASLLDTRYAEAPAISIDYGIMEKTTDIVAVPGDFGWSDLGSWAAVEGLHQADDEGNVRLGGPLVAVDSKNNVIVGDKLVALVGVDDLIVVSTDSAVLVMPKQRAQDVRKVVEALEQRKLDTHL